MPTPRLTNEEILRRVEIWRDHGEEFTAAAKALGKPDTFIRRAVLEADRRGLLDPRDPRVPDGTHIKRRTIQTDAKGNETGRSTVIGPAAGADFKMPKGHALGRMTAQANADGEIERVWYKTGRQAADPDQVARLVRKAFNRFRPAAPVLPVPDCDADRLTVYIFTDWHVGLYAWGAETGGRDWDLTIARRVLAETIAELVSQTPPSGRALVLCLGDLLHADNAKNMTERSGNVLDVDTRHAKCLPTVTDLLTEACELIRARHARVDVVIKPGNHDAASTVGIREGLRLFYRNEANVTVDTSPDPFHWHRFGVNLIGGVHGDQARMPDLPLIMANIRRQDWADTTTRHFHTGHIHHDTLRETGGVHVYSHRAPVAQDAYHAAHGYLSGRSMRAYTYHAERGFRSTTEVEIQ
ncbi:MAG: hypothetical protein CML29_17580 [Rhizobiales bacterium]|nr:hypothetical protein [Hyphomicrobiales bacterium]